MPKPLTNEFGTINADLSAVNREGRTLSRETMAAIAEDYRGANRIHKPFLLLMWIDVKNGNRKNWEN